jgi:hypothetical protein
MRLIHDKEALILIMGVEVDFTDLGEHAKMVVDRMEGASQFGTRIFDFREYQKANTGPDGGIIDNEDGFLRLNYQPDLNTKDPVYLKEFIARVGYYRNTLYSHAERLQGILSRFEWSTKKLKENYRL